MAVQLAESCIIKGPQGAVYTATFTPDTHCILNSAVLFCSIKSDLIPPGPIILEILYTLLHVPYLITAYLTANILLTFSPGPLT